MKKQSGKKLVEILAVELKEWPEAGGAVDAVVQDPDCMVYVRPNDDPDELAFRQNEWIGVRHNHATERPLSELAIDYETAIVTRAEWEAERARLEGEKVMRACVEKCEPESKPKAKTPEVTAQNDGPLQWRDRITEIDRTVEALEEERASLIQKLADEGFKLIKRGALEPEHWKEGDLLECLFNSGRYTRGKLYSFLYHSKEYGSARTLDDKGIENGMLASNFKWHSRPTK